MNAPRTRNGWLGVVLLLAPCVAAIFWSLAQPGPAAQGGPALSRSGLLALSALAALYALYGAFALLRSQRHSQRQALHLLTEQQLAIERASNLQLQQANSVLRDSESKLAVTLASIGDAVIATDARGRITLLNPVAQQLTGWTQEQARGRTMDALFHLVHKHTRAVVVNPVEAVLRTGVPQALTNHTVLVTQQGKEFDIADSCAPIRDPEDQIVGAVLVFRDVTKEHAAQQALHDSSALVQTIFNTVADGIVTVHAQGSRIESVNRAIETMFGYSAAELSGLGLDLLLPELDQVFHDRSLSHYAASDVARGGVMGREVLGRRKNGSTFQLEMIVSDMVLRGQHYFTGILRDNTARKAVEAERLRLDQMLQAKNDELQVAREDADKANQAKSDFLSSMSHELRSPLNAILGFAQLMDTGLPLLTTPQRASVNHILRAGWYLLDLINEVLDLSLIESGKLSLSVEPISLPEILEDCHTLIQPLADKRGIVLHFPAIAGVLFVAGDRTRLKQVLINLLSNAIKYNREGGTVDVTCHEKPDATLRICVQDSGEGLSQEKIGRLFQPFNRLGQEASAGEGTGIGLVVSQRLMQLMGGEIGMSSSVGVGSIFWIELSLTTASTLATPLEQASDGLPPAYARGALRTVLCVEDNQANMDLVEQLIARRPDMRLIGAADGMRGVLMARTHLPDLILMDINLPGISGLQALQLLQDDPRTQHIPVLALSANALPRDIERGLASGFFRYLTKPVKVTEFMEALDTGLVLADEVAHDR